MSFDWKEYLDLAGILCGIDRQTHLRSSISRAYYSAFNIAREKAGYSYKKEFQDDKREIHAKIKQWFKRNGLYNRDGYDIFHKLKGERVEADYNKNCEFKQEDVKRFIFKTQKLLKIINKIPDQKD